MMLSLDTAYRSLGGEVEASSTPTICRLTDSRRHQLLAIAPRGASHVFAGSIRRPQQANLCTWAGSRTYPSVDPAASRLPVHTFAATRAKMSPAAGSRQPAAGGDHLGSGSLC